MWDNGWGSDKRVANGWTVDKVPFRPDEVYVRELAIQTLRIVNWPQLLTFQLARFTFDGISKCL